VDHHAEDRTFMLSSDKLLQAHFEPKKVVHPPVGK
jgi:hypothetical protein